MMSLKRYPIPAMLGALLACAVSTASAMAPPATTTQSFDVFAREHSLATSTHDASPLDTGIFFQSGDALEITASGLWNGGACGDIGPDGTSCFGDGLPGINYYSLVGRIGGGNYFKIGSSYSGTAPHEGNLFLGYLDTDSFNNSGFVTAVVTIPAVPEPGTYALIVGGLGFMAVVSRRKRKAPG